MKALPSLLLIDLDDTIYPSDLGVWNFLMGRIYDFMRLRLDIPPEQLSPLRKRLFDQYGTTLRGLQVEYGVDMQDYLHYVHDVDLSGFLKPDAALAANLKALPMERWIFTNASVEHAENVLGLLGVRPLFAGIIDVVATEPYCKPQPEAFEIALHLAGDPEVGRCLFIDDRLPNLNTARALGLQTLLIGETDGEGHPHIPRLADLPAFLARG